ncbi:50S ribosomal protein L20 [Candidatus Peregrinibacteria bacterium]|nr:50S ribosomal protein L20 [Candidatus Peregrinibacteria bacterium]
MRVKRGFTRRHRHKKILKRAKGHQEMRHRAYHKANESVIKAGQHAYRGRRQKKRDFRSLWIARLSAAVRVRGVSYSRFVSGLKHHSITLDRQTLSELAMHEPEVFGKILESAMKK